VVSNTKVVFEDAPVSWLSEALPDFRTSGQVTSWRSRRVAKRLGRRSDSELRNRPRDKALPTKCMTWVETCTFTAKSQSLRHLNY
jgi:hypothetical protein